jgi:hypothetical protein
LRGAHADDDRSRGHDDRSCNDALQIDDADDFVLTVAVENLDV